MRAHQRSTILLPLSFMNGTQRPPKPLRSNSVRLLFIVLGSVMAQGCVSSAELAVRGELGASCQEARGDEAGVPVELHRAVRERRAAKLAVQVLSDDEILELLGAVPGELAEQGYLVRYELGIEKSAGPVRLTLKSVRTLHDEYRFTSHLNKEQMLSLFAPPLPEAGPRPKRKLIGGQIRRWLADGAIRLLTGRRSSLEKIESRRYKRRSKAYRLEVAKSKAEREAMVEDNPELVAARDKLHEVLRPPSTPSIAPGQRTEGYVMLLRHKTARGRRGITFMMTETLGEDGRCTVDDAVVLRLGDGETLADQINGLFPSGPRSLDEIQLEVRQDEASRIENCSFVSRGSPLAASLTSETSFQLGLHLFSQEETRALLGPHLYLAGADWPSHARRLVGARINYIDGPGDGAAIRFSFRLAQVKTLGTEPLSETIRPMTSEKAASEVPTATGPAWLKTVDALEVLLPSLYEEPDVPRLSLPNHRHVLARTMAEVLSTPCSVMLPGESCELFQVVELESEPLESLSITVDHQLIDRTRICRRSVNHMIPIPAGESLEEQINALTPNGPRDLLRGEDADH